MGGSRARTRWAVNFQRSRRRFGGEVEFIICIYREARSLWKFCSAAKDSRMD
jgi:hypothetical protein